jgi:hypothetical protein
MQPDLSVLMQHKRGVRAPTDPLVPALNGNCPCLAQFHSRCRVRLTMDASAHGLYLPESTYVRFLRSQRRLMILNCLSAATIRLRYTRTRIGALS